jgi:hypothetical protein
MRNNSVPAFEEKSKCQACPRFLLLFIEVLIRKNHSYHRPAGACPSPPLSRRRAPERLPKKGFALFEAKPSLQSPGSIEEHRESRPRRDKWPGAFSFWFFFFGQAKKKNRRMKPISLIVEIAR